MTGIVVQNPHDRLLQKFEDLAARDRGLNLAYWMVYRADRLCHTKWVTRQRVHALDETDVNEEQVYQEVKTWLLTSLRGAEQPDLLARAERLLPDRLAQVTDGEVEWDDADMKNLVNELSARWTLAKLKPYKDIPSLYFNVNGYDLGLDAKIGIICDRSMQRKPSQIWKEMLERETEKRALIKPLRLSPSYFQFPSLALHAGMAPADELLSFGFTPAFPIPDASEASPAVAAPATDTKPVPRIAARPGKPTKRVRGGGPKPKSVLCNLFRDIRCGQLQDYIRSAEISALNGIPKEPAPNLDAAVLVYQRKTNTKRHLDTIRRRCKQEIRAGQLDWEWDENDGPTCSPFKDDDDAS